MRATPALAVRRPAAQPVPTAMFDDFTEPHWTWLHAHSLRVAAYTAELARAMNLDDSFSSSLARAAKYHDIGKLTVPREILAKTMPLTDAEWEVIQRHAEAGHRLLSRQSNGSFALAASVAMHHHERFDGTGYPNRLRGADIPMEARIVAVCDVYAALREERPYKPGVGHSHALNIIFDGDQRVEPEDFDPDVLEAFASIVDTVEQIAASDPTLGHDGDFPTPDLLRAYSLTTLSFAA
jgi:putative two-component system response regulator